jgi:hypothetical protein
VSKFTPGPWKLGRCGQILGEDGEFICSARKRNITQYQKSPTEKANAALIAAAPELYEALEFMAKVYRNERGLDGAFDSCLTLAEKALAKARGDKQTLSSDINQ